MRTKVLWVVLVTVIIGAAVWVGKVQATPQSGFAGTTIAVGRFGDIEASNHLVLPNESSRRRHHKNLWLSFQKSKGDSDLYVQNNVWAPGGTTGWHRHPGPSLIFVIDGTVTDYEGDDPTCTGHAYSAGQGFVDSGEGAHTLRNEGSVQAETVAVQLVPAGAPRKIDVTPGPDNCPF